MRLITRNEKKKKSKDWNIAEEQIKEWDPLLVNLKLIAN